MSYDEFKALAAKSFEVPSTCCIPDPVKMLGTYKGVYATFDFIEDSSGHIYCVSY